MYKLKKEDVLHVASLAKLNINNAEKYQKDLDDILNSIEEIISLDINSDIMISPNKNQNKFSDYSNDIEVDILSNAKNKVGEFIKVEDMRWVNILIYP